MERVIVWHRWSPPAEASRAALALATGWRIAARERFVQAGAELLLELSGVAAFALASSELERAVELCLHALREAEREGSGAGGVACGIAVGTIERAQPDGAYLGDAIDRAQALANVAGAHELLLDPAAQAASNGAFLFARELSFGLGLNAAALDHTFPRRSDCQRALVHLSRPSFARTGQVQFDLLRRLVRSGGRHRVLLVGPPGSGISHWIARIAEETAPSAWLEVRALGAALSPLSGLMYALRRLKPESAPERLCPRPEGPDRQALDTLAAIRAGQAVARRDALVALRHFVARASEAGGRALVTVDPAPRIDPSTVGLIAEAARDPGPELAVMIRLFGDQKPPEAFARGGRLSEIRVRGLSHHEGQALAASMLRAELPNDVARRAAAMGGANPLAVAEAVRVLVASGDVVFEQNAFRWRRGPAGRPNTMALDALLEERVDALSAPLRRVLELLAVLPEPDDRAFALALAERDGFGTEAFSRALEQLDAFGLLRLDGRAIELADPVRRVVQMTLGPARSVELYRTLAAALAQQLGPEPSFVRADLAYYLARSGRMGEAAQLFLEVAALSGQLGFVRSGVRLAAAAVECDPAPATRSRAAQIAEQLSERQHASPKRAGSRPPPAPESREHARSAPPPRHNLAREAQQRAVRAILARDFDALERALDLMVAAGRDGGSVDRLRAVALLAKGEPVAAASLVERMRERAAEPRRETPRLTLTAALVAIGRGELEQAVRASLGALARTRDAGDALGERAALSVLAMCYQKLGREADATRLAQAALKSQAGVAILDGTLAAGSARE